MCTCLLPIGACRCDIACPLHVAQDFVAAQLHSWMGCLCTGLLLGRPYHGEEHPVLVHTTYLHNPRARRPSPPRLLPLGVQVQFNTDKRASTG
jgi:hypothetical protein